MKTEAQCRECVDYLNRVLGELQSEEDKSELDMLGVSLALGLRDGIRWTIGEDIKGFDDLLKDFRQDTAHERN